MGKFSIKQDYKISEDAAVEQVKLIITEFCIDVDSYDDKEEKRTMESALRRVTQHIRAGRIEVTGGSDFKITQNLASGDTIEYGTFTGKNHAEMDAADADKNYERMFKLLGSVSGLGSGAIEQLKGPDLKAAETLSVLFL